MTTNQKTQFAIIANVAFAIPAIMKGAFNSHHKARLTKDGEMGKVTAEGAKFFSNRSRLNDAELKAAVTEAKFSLAKMAGGFIWAVSSPDNKGAVIAWQAGQGAIGQTLFANALSELTQSAQKAQTKAKPSNPTKAKPKAQQKAMA